MPNAREMGGCARCKDPNRESAEYAIKNRTDRFCDDCARTTHAIYTLTPAPPMAPDSPARAAGDSDDDEARAAGESASKRRVRAE